MYSELLDAVDDLLRLNNVEVSKFSSCRAYEEDVEGKRYTHDTLCSEGIKKEGDAAKSYKTEIGAVGAYIEVLEKYVEGKTGSLVWRRRPGISTYEGEYYVSSRLTFIPKGTEIKQSVWV